MALHQIDMYEKHLTPQNLPKGIVVTYGAPDDAHKAKEVLDAATIDAAMIGGPHKFEIIHIPWRSCTGCKNPQCTYDEQPGAWCAKFISESTD